MRRYLVVANQTLGGDELAKAIRDRVAGGPCEFWVVVPATPRPELAPRLPPMPVMGGVPTLQMEPAEARRLAQDRLRSALGQLTGAGATADGEVGDPNPMRAVEAALKGRQFDEIIVSTLPARVSHWLHQDLPQRLQHKFHLPVTHVAATE